MSEFNLFGPPLIGDVGGVGNSLMEAPRDGLFERAGSAQALPEARTDDILTNFGIGVREQIDGFKALGSMVAQNPSILLEVASSMPGAIADSYRQWWNAAASGDFIDEVQRRPLEFMQDIAAPLLAVFSGGASMGARFGSAGGSVARILAASGKVAGGAAMVADPLGAGMALGGAALSIGPLANAWRRAMRAGSSSPLPDAKGVKQPMIDPAAMIGATQEIPPRSGTTVPGTNIRMRDIGTREQADELLTTVANEIPEEIDLARRGTIDNAKSFEDAWHVDPKKILNRKTGQALNDRELVAADLLVRMAAADILDAKRALKSSGLDSDRMAFANAMSTGKLATQSWLGAKAEAGRSLGIFRAIAQRGRVAQGPDAMAEFLKKHFDGSDNIDDAMNLMDLMGDNPEKLMQAVAKAPPLSPKVTFWDKALEVIINWSFLSGPKTHAVNFNSNLINSMANIGEHGVAAGISKLLRRKKHEGVSSEEVFARVNGWMRGSAMGLRAAKHTFLTEEPALRIPGKAVELGPQRAIKGKLGAFVRVPGLLLLTSDALFQTIGYQQEIGAVGVREALKQVEKGRITNEGMGQFVEDFIQANQFPTEPVGGRRVTLNEHQKRAQLIARYQTWTNPLVGTVKKTAEVIQDLPWLKVFVPFIRTPTNLIKYASDRSFIAPIRKEIRENLKGTHGLVEQELAMSRMLLGSSVQGATAWLWAQNLITGGGPADHREKQLKRQSGWAPYSLRLPFSMEEGSEATNLSFNRFEPWAIGAGATADLLDLAEHMTLEEGDKAGAMAFMAVHRTLVSRTWLQGLSNLLELVSDPQRATPQFMEQLAGMGVPNLLNQTARALDPTLRQINGVTDKLKSRVPGLKSTLSKKLDLFGNDITVEAFGLDLFSPVYMNPVVQDKVVDELQAARVFPDMPEDTINGVDLTPAQYEDYVRDSGKAAHRNLRQLVDTSIWGKLSENQKQKAALNVIDDARDAARQRMFLRFPELMEQRIQISLDKLL